MISKFSVKKTYTVLVGVILSIVLGIVSFSKMTADLLPNMSLPYVIVMTTYIGASPETVEMVVTKPIEKSMATVSNIESIQSVSSENYSMVVLEFSQKTDMDTVSLEIREKLDQIYSYWKNDLIGNPMIMKLNPDMMPIMMAAAGVEGMDMPQVSTYVKDVVVPELERIEGVASVTPTGLIEESVNVIIRQDKIDALNDQIKDVINKQMSDAEKELADGKADIYDGLSKVVDGQQELENGQKELDQGKSELTNGKNALKNQQNAVIGQLADGQTKLLTAKADLESAKTTIASDLALLNQLTTQLSQLEELQSNAPIIIQSLTSMRDGFSRIYDTAQMQGEEVLRTQMEQCKDQCINNPYLPTDLKNALEPLDWVTSFKAVTPGQPDQTTVCGILNGYIQNLNSLPQSIEALKGTIAIKSLCKEYNKEATEKYIQNLDVQKKALEAEIVKLDQQLTELSKQENSALIGFANGMTEITMGESKMQDAQGKLDSAKAELDQTKEQLENALSDIKDGEEQLKDAKEEAYDQADMTGVLTVETVSALLQAQNFSMPAGYVTEDGISYLVRIGDKSEQIEDMSKLPLINLNMDGMDVITLEDVADVFYVDNSDEVYTNVNGNPGVMIAIQKQTGYSTGEVSDLLAIRFQELMDENPNLELIPLMDQGIYIDLVMDSIISNVVVGALLAIFILILFLKDLRPTLIVAISIPISLVTAIVCMYFSGVTLNVISLSGLALGIGMLVDNSIVVIENIYRLRNEGYSMKDAAIEGAKEVAGAIMASTLTTICVFAPIVFTEGITRQLFVDMGLTIAYSLLASLLIALTVVPAMASKTLRKTKVKKQGKLFDRIVSAYAKVLSVSLKGKAVIIVLVIVLLVGSFFAASSNGIAFMSDMDSTQFSVRVQLSDEATFKETKEITDTVVNRLLEMEEVQNVGAMVSASTAQMLMGDSSGKNNATEIYVTTVPDKKRSNEEIADLILENTKDLDAEITVNIESMDMSAMGGSGVSIRVEGRDLETLQSIAKDLSKLVGNVEGISEVSDGMEESTEEFRITVKKEKAMEHGLTVAQVFQQISEKLAESSSATTLEEVEKDYGVYVINEADEMLTRESLKDFKIESKDKDGKKTEVLLSEIADFYMTESLNSIQREGQSRYITVSATLEEGYNIGKVSKDVEKAVSNYEFPSGYHIEFAGENETIIDAMKQVFLMLVLALLFMYLIMVAQFQSLLSPFIIMFTIPLAFTGGFLGLFVTGSEISVIAMIGFVMLSGIIVNNGIVLIDYMNQLRFEGMEKKEAIITAGKTRLRPVLMTALTTILALSTMVFSHDMGAEMMKPMAIVTIGGLVYGTLLTLIVIPCIYDMFIRNKKKEIDEIEEIETI